MLHRLRRVRGHTWYVLVLLSILGVTVAGSVDPARAEDPTPVPRAGFADTLVLAKSKLPTNLQPMWGGPTDMEWTSTGLMILTLQRGYVFVYQNNQAKLALNINSSVCFNSERGLVGLAIDPNFASTGYIYLFYTRKTDPACPLANRGDTSGFPINRVSRFVMDQVTGTIDPASEVVLVDHLESYAGNHNSGYLHIGADGYLYISAGETGKQALAGRDDTLRGKILRVNRATGDGAPDNPFGSDPQAVRCGDPAQNQTETGKPCREVFAKGLRNPFRLAFRPGTSEFFIDDVGKKTWEEISVGAKGASYGWPEREGPCSYEIRCVSGSTQAPGGLTQPNDPIFWYLHTESGYQDADPSFNGCNAITGGAFVPTGAWPSEYSGDYMFGDYVCGRIWQLQPDGNGRYQASVFVSGLLLNSVVGMAFGPSPSGQSLYYTTINGGGQIHRIDYTGGGNRAPTAQLSASPTSGSPPLVVTFNGGGSSDPDGDALTYLWDFGVAGQTRTTTTPTTSFTYSAAGSYTATLVVRDSHGVESLPVTVGIVTGNQPPHAQIQGPATTETFAVGEQIMLQAVASDADGIKSLDWEVLLHHNEHTHPWDTGTQPSITLTFPAPEDLEATQTSYLEVNLIVEDNAGLTTTVTRELRPHIVNVTLASQPTGMQVLVNRVPSQTQQTLKSWEGYEFSVSAPAQPNGAGQWMMPKSWSDGAPIVRTIRTPDTNTTYTLTFTQAQKEVMPQIGR